MRTDNYSNAPVVIDIGSGFTKMGYAGNVEPQFVIPTVVANIANKRGGVHTSHAQGAGSVDMGFYIGDEAMQRNKDSPNHILSYPVSKGRIENWDDMERFLQQAIFRNLRCSPEEHCFLLTEPPFNPPENRELTAEIMFETFNVKGLHIAVQAVLSLYMQWVYDGGDPTHPDLTGLVVDSGDGLTHAIPVANNFVIGSCIQEMGLGGRHVTKFISDMLTDRGEPVPPDQRFEAAGQIKEQHSYICRDVPTEYQKFDQDPKKFKVHSGIAVKNREPWSIQVGYERFLAPEIFFHPEIFVDNVTTPLPEVVDNCILQCPIDYRRRLYGNIMLSGGSTIFTHFKERLERDVQNIVDDRLRKVKQHTGAPPEPIEVKVHGNGKKKHQRFAAWLGGSLFAQHQDYFHSIWKTKQEYDEVGPSCMRASAVNLG